MNGVEHVDVNHELGIPQHERDTGIDDATRLAVLSEGDGTRERQPTEAPSIANVRRRQVKHASSQRTLLGDGRHAGMAVSLRTVVMFRNVTGVPRALSSGAPHTLESLMRPWHSQ